MIACMRMEKEIFLFLEKFEGYLLSSNLSTKVVKEIMDFLAYKVIRDKSLTKEAIVENASNRIQMMISEYIASFNISQMNSDPYVMLVCGVNGSGKTTTIGKMVHILKDYGWDVMIAGCDTYRAGASQQLLGCVNDDPENFIFMSQESDTPAKIAVKAYNKAVEKKKDILIIDTSGRLHNNQDLMSELLKIKHKLHEISYYAPNDIILIIDSSCGYNAIEQVKTYNDLIGITGIIATKLDIAKSPGMILSICKEFGVKIFGFCNGEAVDKISDVNPKDFADAVLRNIGSIM